MATPPDFTAGQVLTAAQMNQIGLWLVNATSFTAAATVSVNNCFSADYTNYVINIVSNHTTTTADLNLRFRVGGSDNTTSNYNYVLRRISSAGAGFDLRGEARTTNLAVIGANIANYFGQVYISSPFATERTAGTGFASSANNGNGDYSNFSFSATTSFDGFTIYPASGAITGTLKVYGYRN